MRQSSTAAGSAAPCRGRRLMASASTAAGSVPAGGGQREVLTQHRPAARRRVTPTARLSAMSDSSAIRSAPRRVSAAVPRASWYMSAAAPMRVNGSWASRSADGARRFARRRGPGFGQHVDGGVGVGGFGGQDAVRVGFGGGQIDVVFHLAAGQRHVEQLAGQAIAADDVAGVPGGQALGGVDGGGVAEGDVGGDVAGGQRAGAGRCPGERRAGSRRRGPPGCVKR